MDKALLTNALACKCPKCGEGDLYKPGFTMDMQDKCTNCGLNLSDSDSADGPAFFLICILGFVLVPLALWLEWTIHPPLWAHAVIWTIVALAATVGTLRPLKAYIIGLQFKYRPGDWEK